MKRLLLVVVLAATGCSDIYYMRRADSAYEIAIGIHDRKCVLVKRVKDQAQYEECEREKAQLQTIKNELDSMNDAMMKGPLPAQARMRLRQISRGLS